MLLRGGLFYHRCRAIRLRRFRRFHGRVRAKKIMRVARSSQRRIHPRAVRTARSAPRWILPSVRAALVGTDAVLAAASYIAAYSLRESAPFFAPASGGRFVWSEDFAPYGALIILIVPIRVISFLYCNLYKLRGDFLG